MKVKTSNLIDHALNWAVAKALNLNPRFFTERAAYEAHVLKQTLKCGDYIIVLRPNKQLTPLAKYNGYNDGVCWKDTFSPSTDWKQGGPIIEREKLNLDTDDSSSWLSYTPEAKHQQFGPTPLIAAMRCFVASKLGDEVEVPEELQRTPA